MLRSDQIRPAADHEARAPAASTPAELVDVILGFLRRQYAVILSVALLIVMLGAVYVFTAPRSFTAQAKLIIDARKFQVLQQSPILGDMNVDFMTMESQIQLLKSDNIALAVIRRLRLTEDPEFAGSDVHLNSGGGVKDTQSPRPPSDELTEVVLSAFQKRLDITRIGGSSVIEIKFKSTDPERAAQIANAVGEAYVADQLDLRRQATKLAGAWLRDRLPELRDQSSTAEHAIVDFKAKNNIVAAAGQLMNEQQVAALNSDLVAAQGRTSEARVRLDQIEAVIHANKTGPANAATVTDTLSNPIITQLRSKYLEYVNREADFSARYGRDHLAAANLRRQIAEVRGSILDELRRIAESYKSEYEIAKQRQLALERAFNESVAQFKTANQAQVTLRELEGSAQRYRALEDTFLQRYMDAVHQQSFPVAEARFISRASKPVMPSGPKRSLMLGLAAAGGLFSGVGFGMLREWRDRAFRTSGKVEEAVQTNCIAVTPNVERSQSKELIFKQEFATTLPPQTIVPDANVIWTVINSPFSRYTESIRSVKLSLNEGVGLTKVVGFTSSLPGEGKSTIAASLALLTAQAGARVILVDCDLRNPSLSPMLAASSAGGIVDVTSGKCSLEDVIWRESSTNLAFLPGSIKSRLACSSEVLASEAMQELFNRLRQDYDYVLVDLPPLAPIVDVRATAQFVDLYTLVIEWGRTSIDVVEHALAGARVVEEKLHGVVLNKVDFKWLSRYEGPRGRYYRNKHYASYEFTE